MEGRMQRKLERKRQKMKQRSKRKKEKIIQKNKEKKLQLKELKKSFKNTEYFDELGNVTDTEDDEGSFFFSEIFQSLWKWCFVAMIYLKNLKC